MITNLQKYWLILILSILLLIITGCRQIASTTEPAVSEATEPALITLAVVQTENALLKTRLAEVSHPSATSIPPTATHIQSETASNRTTATFTPYPQQTITLPADLVSATHPEVSGYVFLIDPEIWTVEKLPAEPYKYLSHKEITGCRIDVTLPETEDLLLRQYLETDSRLQWIAHEYETYVSYQRPDLSLDLIGFDLEDCLNAQEDILNHLVTKEEFEGAPTVTPIPTSTDRPGLTGFTCPDTLPPHIRIGDYSLIIADFLWLRKEPNPENAGAEIRLFPQYAPIAIRVIGGPKCISPFIYWEVEVSELSEDGEKFTGWMAESDGENYFLDIWNPVW